MSKFFISRENIYGDKLKITGEDVNHITRVLRLGTGDRLTCCDGMGKDYCVRISATDKKEIVCDIESAFKAETESSIKVTLIQGIPKVSKMDYIIQKTTELGISDIYPCKMSRCVSKPDGSKKVERWQKIAREAAKQSGRGIVPSVHDIITVSEAVEILKNTDISFVPYECAENAYLRPVLTSKNDVKTVAFMIGPEGGFDKSEIEKLTANNINIVTLGKRILRTETAGEAVLSMIMYEIGDINGGL
ncbi:MAG: 16S rRNA (uracil(1498)-N(3))-methyltransferase [Firmicutes bacterium]|nr:16S rRNA (uracil(1498)-N(3))-methyltransferase [Bacillota bacterium]